MKWPRIGSFQLVAVNLIAPAADSGGFGENGREAARAQSDRTEIRAGNPCVGGCQRRRSYVGKGWRATPDEDEHYIYAIVL